MVDLNADLGEVEGDLALMAIVTSANVACGGHAGDAATMAAALAEAAARGVVVGAHPSYLDREGFGRRECDAPPRLVARQVAEQVERLCALGEVRYVKLHGALYHRANHDAALAEAILEALPVHHVLAQPGHLVEAARRRGFGATIEGFCDRAYNKDGSLVDRSLPGALLTDPAAVVAQAVTLAGRVGSLCLHGDTPGALELATVVRRGLVEAGVDLSPFA